MRKPPKINFFQKGNKLELQLEGTWRSLYIKQMEQAFKEIKVPAQSSVSISFESLDILDTTGAYFLQKFLKKIKQKNIPYELIEGSSAVMATLKFVEEYELSGADQKKFQKKNIIKQFLNDLGQKTIQSGQTLIEAISFLGQVTMTMGHLLRHPRQLRFVTLVDLIYKVGVSALPIVGLISFLIGIVLVYQGADQLRRFGAEIFTINLLAVSALRELGILLTAIVVAGRSGSAYTAQLGFMKLNQEIDALRVLGFEPFEILVVPRIMALLIALPLLTFFSDMMALVGGGITTYFLLGISPADFCHQLLLAIKPWTFWIGLIKAPVFAFFIALIACFEGMRVSGGAERVGYHTTQSVVESIFLVLVLDALFSIIFSFIGI